MAEGKKGFILIEWSSDDRFDRVFLCPEQINKYEEILSGMRMKKEVSQDLRYLYKSLFRLGRNRYKEFQEKLRNQPRVDAQKFIGNKQIRDIIFNEYGKICLRCGSTEKISIDHIIPIYKNGLNELNNLQPLCSSCNSWKGTEIIDFR